MNQNLLITQCLQNDFVQRIEKYDPLPNILHIGYSESLRLIGELPEEGPVNTVMEWAYRQSQDQLKLIHIRDWHRDGDPDQTGHLRQFGSHCLENSPGAEFVFKSKIVAGRNHEIINASGLNDFIDTPLEKVLSSFKGKKIRCGIMGVWTEAKVLFLCYDLRTRFPDMELAVCSSLTASSSREMHFISLDQMKNILGVRIIDSAADFTSWLAGSIPDLYSRISSRNDTAKIIRENEMTLSPADEKLILYLYRNSREIRVKCLDGGFSGNVVLKAVSTDIHGHQEVPTVIKIGPRDLIAKERASFERIQEVMGNNAPAIVDSGELENRGGIKYRYASMIDGNVRTFQSIYQEGSDPGLIESIIDTTFRGELGRLYQAATLEKIDLLDYYDFNPKYASGVRKRVEAITGRPENDPVIRMEDLPEIPNICHFYETDLKELSDNSGAQHYTSFIHGDLNGRNIMVDSRENVWLIDFFHTHKGHVIRDFIKMENDILYIFTPADSVQSIRETAALIGYLTALEDLGTLLPETPPFPVTSPPVLKAWTAIRQLRKIMSRFIHLDRAPFQYHCAAMRYSVHTLSFDESTLPQRRLALYASGLLMNRIKQYLTYIRTLSIDLLNYRFKHPDAGLGLTILPGRKDRGRSLNDDITEILRQGYRTVVSLITPFELEEYGVPDLYEAYQKAGLKVITLPVLDQSVPDRSEMIRVFDEMEKLLDQGEKILIHCVGGLGRSGLLAAGYLTVKEHLPPDESIQTVRQSRSVRAIENSTQENFVKNLNQEGKRI